MVRYSVTSMLDDEHLGSVLGNDYMDALVSAVGIYGEFVSISLSNYSRPATDIPTTISTFVPAPVNVMFEFISYKNPFLHMMPDIDMEALFGDILDTDELPFGEEE